MPYINNWTQYINAARPLSRPERDSMIAELRLHTSWDVNKITDPDNTGNGGKNDEGDK